MAKFPDLVTQRTCYLVECLCEDGQTQTGIAQRLKKRNGGKKVEGGSQPSISNFKKGTANSTDAFLVYLFIHEYGIDPLYFFGNYAGPVRYTEFRRTDVSPNESLRNLPDNEFVDHICDAVKERMSRPSPRQVPSAPSAPPRRKSRAR